MRTPRSPTAVAATAGVTTSGRTRAETRVNIAAAGADTTGATPVNDVLLDIFDDDRTAAGRLITVAQDIASLTDHASFLNSKVTFLLDATLGMISIQQNAIIKIFSVVAVIFLPPTLIASIYGMNFQVMPELTWSFGYPLALVLMLISAVLPYLIFKARGWL